MVKQHTRERAELVFPKGLIYPEDWLRFVETKAFSRRREELGFTDDDIRALQVGIMISPIGAPVIPGTGGVRKLRCARDGDNRGKRSSYRVLYVYFPLSGIAVLITAYEKNEQDNISDADKPVFRKLIKEIEEGLAEGRKPKP